MGKPTLILLVIAHCDVVLNVINNARVTCTQIHTENQLFMANFFNLIHALVC